MRSKVMSSYLGIDTRKSSKSALYTKVDTILFVHHLCTYLLPKSAAAIFLSSRMVNEPMPKKKTKKKAKCGRRG